MHALRPPLDASGRPEARSTAAPDDRPERAPPARRGLGAGDEPRDGSDRLDGLSAPRGGYPLEPDSVRAITWRDDADAEQLEPRELSPSSVALLLFLELRRPPWYREIDRERKALRAELG